MADTTDYDCYNLRYDLNTVFEENLTTKAQVEEIQEWMSTEKLTYLPNDLVVLFLITNDCDIEAAKINIITYFEVKNDAPELFDNRNVDASDVVKATNTALIIYSPIRTQDNCTVFIFKLLDTNYKHFDLTTVLKLGFMIIDLSLMQHPPAGLHSIIDMKGSGVMHLTHFKLHILKKFFRYVQEALPITLRNVHIVNTTIVFYRFLGLARIVMKPGILKLIRVQKAGSDDLHEFLKEYISPQCLPQEYGGLLPTIPELQVANIDELHAMTPYFEAEERFRKTPRTDSKKLSMVQRSSTIASCNRISERVPETKLGPRMSKVSRKSDCSGKNEVI